VSSFSKNFSNKIFSGSFAYFVHEVFTGKENIDDEGLLNKRGSAYKTDFVGI
jgi:hypothetical protein